VLCYYLMISHAHMIEVCTHSGVYSFKCALIQVYNHSSHLGGTRLLTRIHQRHLHAEGHAPIIMGLNVVIGVGMGVGMRMRGMGMGMRMGVGMRMPGRVGAAVAADEFEDGQGAHDEENGSKEMH